MECECCGNNTDCDDCDGSGEGDPIPGQFSYNYEYMVEIDKSCISVDCIENIVHLLINLGVSPEETIKMIASEVYKPHLFEVKDIKFISVPVHSGYTEKDFMIKVC